MAFKSKIVSRLAIPLFLASATDLSAAIVGTYAGTHPHFMEQGDIGTALHSTYTVTDTAFGQPVSTTVEAIANVTKLGLEVKGDNSGVIGRAAIFENIAFATGNTNISTSSLSFGVVGTWTGNISVTTGAAFDAGNSGAAMYYFDSYSELGISFGNTLLDQVTSVGAFSRAYNLSQPLMLLDPEIRFGTYPGWCAHCVDLSNVYSSEPILSSFRFGLAFNAYLFAETLTYGEISSLNSFDLEGLVAFDENGNRVDGLFISESGIDMGYGSNFGNVSPYYIGVSQVPLPATAPLVLLGAVLLTLARSPKSRPEARDQRS